MAGDDFLVEPKQIPSNNNNNNNQLSLLSIHSGTPRSVGNRSSSTANTPRPSLHRIQVILSRPSYQPGGTVVGTVRWKDDKQENNINSSSFSSISLYVAGFCRLDNRWHKNCNYSQVYPIYNNNNHNYYYTDDDHDHEENDEKRKHLLENHLPLDFPDRNSVFWISNTLDHQACIDLVKLDPRSPTCPSWELCKPRPIRYSPDWADQTTNEELPIQTHSDITNNKSNNNNFTPPCCLDFTFRADLPPSLPGTLANAISCRYSYAVLLRLESPSGATTWLETPILLQKCSHPKPILDSYHLAVLPHSDSLPCQLTATELYGASPHYQKGSLTVHRFSSSFHVNSAPGPILRITDPFLSQPVAVLTLIAPLQFRPNDTQSTLCLYPGSTLYLQFDFPSNDVTAPQWVPCVQVSACLQGEESVVLEELTETSPRKAAAAVLPNHAPKKRLRAQQILLSTAHELIDPETTQRVSLSLLVPDNVICSLQTPAVEISYECLVDIVVTGDNNNSQKQKFRNLRLQLPITILHSPTALETMAMDLDPDQEEETARLSRQQKLWHLRNNNPAPRLWDDILDDLKRLSIVLAEDNGWTLTPP